MPGPGVRARLCGRPVTSPKGPSAAQPGGFQGFPPVPPVQSAKLAPKYGVPVVETPEVLGETVREPVVVILVPSEGR
ncbi:hypothetical protein GCM10010339_67410 [Streptomyces alanosinicus]|uniref:Uncharacterized protein n=1 Tax=Streptomyces alanosinicus TaxID=68171 RepID=A0A918YNK4_9ACTN|nr:hypothetical protein GCM10010339_67410 [Streptomyces alanosinicus]